MKKLAFLFLLIVFANYSITAEASQVQSKVMAPNSQYNELLKKIPASSSYSGQDTCIWGTNEYKNQYILDTINKERKSKNLNTLKWSDNIHSKVRILDEAIQYATTNTGDHIGSPFGSGENLFFGPAFKNIQRQWTLPEIHTAFKGSKVHYDNYMRSDIKEMTFEVALISNCNDAKNLRTIAVENFYSEKFSNPIPSGNLEYCNIERKSNQVIKTCYYDKKTKTIITTYNQLNLPVHKNEFIYHSNRKVKSKMTTSYDTNGKRTRNIRSTYNTSGIKTSTDEFKYYTSGKVKSKMTTNYSSNGIRTRNIRSNYDAKGVKTYTEEFKYYSNGKVVKSKKYTYYNSKGNITKSYTNHYNTSGKITHTTK